MSLILEALKKSEEKRRLGEAPNLATPFSAPRRRSILLPVSIAIIAAGLLWWALRSPEPTPEATHAGNAATAPGARAPASRASSPSAGGSVASSSMSDNSRNNAPPIQTIPEPTGQTAGAPLHSVTGNNNLDETPPPTNLPKPGAGNQPPMVATGGAPNAAMRAIQQHARERAMANGASSPSGASAAAPLSANQPATATASSSAAPRTLPPATTPATPAVAATTPTAATATRTPPATPTVAAPTQTVATARTTPATNAAVPTAAPTTSPSPTAASIAKPAAPVAPVTPPARAPKTPDTIGLPASNGTSAPPAAPAPSAQPYSELAFSVRKSLPDLHLSMHVYTADPAQRFVILNDARVTEGEKVGDDLFVREIRPDGVVLEFQNQRFFYPRDGL